MEWHRGINLYEESTESEEDPEEDPIGPEPEPEPIDPIDPIEPDEEPEPDSPEIAMLKFRLREKEYPMFTNEELQGFIDSSESLDMATYRAALYKSESNGLTLNGLTIPDTSKFFLRIASMYRPYNSGTLKGI